MKPVLHAGSAVAPVPQASACVGGQFTCSEISVSKSVPPAAVRKRGEITVEPGSGTKREQRRLWTRRADLEMETTMKTLVIGALALFMAVPTVASAAEADIVITNHRHHHRHYVRD